MESQSTQPPSTIGARNQYAKIAAITPTFDYRRTSTGLLGERPKCSASESYAAVNQHRPAT